MRNKLFLSATCLSLLMFNTAKAIEHRECVIEFKENSSVVLQNRNELDSCFSELKGKNIESVTIIGSATKSGSAKRNKDLAYERALTVSRTIKAKFPNAIIKNISVGANEEIGKNTHVHFILTDQSESKQTAQLQNKIDDLEQKNKVLEKQATAEKKKNLADNYHSFFDENPNVRLAASLGMGSTRVDQRRDYISGGGEISWINRDSYARPEVGIKASTSIDGIEVDGDSVDRISNAYGFFGVGATALGLVGGVRLLVGGEWIDIAKNIPHQDQLAVGGEARIGYEWKRGISLFASYALTEHIQTVGIDLGLSL